MPRTGTVGTMNEITEGRRNWSPRMQSCRVVRAQPGMDETRIRILIDKRRQHLTKKVEETLGRAGEEWAAQATELHILCADAENRQKEGRGFYKMDEASIQNLHADLTEDYHSLVKYHTAVS